MKARLDKYGRLTIPKAVRVQLGLTHGTTFDVEVRGHLVRLLPSAGDAAPEDLEVTARVNVPEALRWQRLEKLSAS